MAGPIWVVGEPADGGLASISTEVATAARQLAEASGSELAGVVAGAEPSAGAAALARYIPRVFAIDVPDAAEHAWAAAVAPFVAALAERESPAWILLGTSADGRDLAGMLSALLGRGALVNAGSIAWSDAGPTIETSVFGGRLVTTGGFRADSGIVTVRPNTVTAAPLDVQGSVERSEVAPASRLPAVRVVDRVAESGAAASLEEAKIIVTGGRGVGGPEGFGIVRELADALGGVVGATRAAVDAGWIPYARQVGQTGKVVKPQLYVALGVSGAIQHKVGMQSSASIVAINRDPDAPIAEFADLFVVGDLFDVVPALLAQLRDRRG